MSYEYREDCGGDGSNGEMGAIQRFVRAVLSYIVSIPVVLIMLVTAIPVYFVFKSAILRKFTNDRSLTISEAAEDVIDSLSDMIDELKGDY